MATRARIRLLIVLLALFGASTIGLGQPVDADQSFAANELSREYAAQLSSGWGHTCVIDLDADVRCWGGSGNGQLGYGNTDKIGDNETPSTAGTVNLGVGRTAVALSAGLAHTCAILDDGSVSCWGYNGSGQLGYGNTDDIGDNETPNTAGPVNLGVGRTAVAISAGQYHTCAILDNGTVRCWGENEHGQLGYGNTDDIGDNETPNTAGPVDLGGGRTAVAITTGSSHTCAILDDATVRCWGGAWDGQLGYGNTTILGDNELPSSVGTVDLGGGRTATAISAGQNYTCAILDNGTVRCWGIGFGARLGYGNTDSIGDDELPSSVGPVNIGAGRTAVAISTEANTCVILDNGALRCWGDNGFGTLGYGNTDTIGDDETPDTAGPVDLGDGRVALAVTNGQGHTCALLDNSTVSCWGWGAHGQLGLADTQNIGDNETPDAAPPVDVGGELASVGSLAVDGDESIAEGNSGSANVTVDVTLDRVAPFDVTVDYETTDGTATAGSDYTAVSGQLTFAAGETAAEVDIPVLGDEQYDGNETFTLSLSSPAPAVELSDDAATVTITEDDDPSGYWMLERDGTIYEFGDAEHYGDASGDLESAAVDFDASPTGMGYWILDRDGEVHAYGDATTHAPTNALAAGLARGEHAVAITATPDGGGYWLFTNTGRVATYGNATFHGDMSEVTLNGPVVDAAATPAGDGYYMVGSDGGVFAFGAATFQGSMGGTPLNDPVNGVACDPDGAGYWLAASDGGVFSFDAEFHGSMGGTPLNDDVTGMAATTSGYLLVGADGGAFAFGGAPFHDSLGADPPDTDVVALIAQPS